MTNSDRFIALRDGLLRTREDWARACNEFRWPQFEEFNWVGDYFEVIAAGNDATALRMVDDAGGDRSISFASMAVRAAQLAAFSGKRCSPRSASVR
jgi:acetyl-CoA synthetase